MLYRNFGNTGLSVSEAGFGAWAIGGNAMIGETAIGWGNVDDSESRSAIHKALDMGINFFDTADIYGLGHSEKIIGNTIGNRDDVVIATKGGNVSRNEQFTTDYSKQYLIKACEESLVRLKREAIDYYQLHSARIKDLEQKECIEAMELLKKQGKIRFWGLSLNTFDPAPEAEYLMNNNSGNGFQLVLNILNQRALTLMKTASGKGYGIIARMPLQFGLLTGKFDDKSSFVKGDHRKNRLTPEIISEVNTSLEPVWMLCKKYECTKSQLALSYILSYKEVSTVIPGIRTIEQAIENFSGLFRMEENDRLMIESLNDTSFVKIMETIQARG